MDENDLDKASQRREKVRLYWMAAGAILFLILGLASGGAGVLAWEQRSRRAAFEELQRTAETRMKSQGITGATPASARFSIACTVSACYRLDSFSGDVLIVPPGKGIEAP